MSGAASGLIFLYIGSFPYYDVSIQWALKRVGEKGKGWLIRETEEMVQFEIYAIKQCI